MMIHAADKDDWFILDQILLEISQPRCQRLLGVNGRIVYLFGKRPKVKRYDEASKFPSMRFLPFDVQFDKIRSESDSLQLCLVRALSSSALCSSTRQQQDYEDEVCWQIIIKLVSSWHQVDPNKAFNCKRISVRMLCTRFQHNGRRWGKWNSFCCKQKQIKILSLWKFYEILPFDLLTCFTLCRSLQKHSTDKKARLLVQRLYSQSSDALSSSY